MSPWYRESANSKEFKNGLKNAALIALTMAKVFLGIESKKGKKVRSKFEAISKEIERRKKFDKKIS